MNHLKNYKLFLEANKQSEFYFESADYLMKRIPFLKNFELNFDVYGKENSSVERTITFFKTKRVKNVEVTIPTEDKSFETIQFNEIYFRSEFIYTRTKPNETQTLSFILDSNAITSDEFKKDEILKNIYSKALEMKMKDVLSYSNEIRFEETLSGGISEERAKELGIYIGEIPEDVLNKIFNEINGVMFKIEDFLESQMKIDLT